MKKNRPVSIRKNKFIVKKLSGKETPDSDGFRGKFCHMCKKSQQSY